mmetsp:Transcript_836/g.1729  ORF Transcript_836/g.1729 Transcript_836/m.1729 type:complete len:95 (+) Transcript_836:1051-1335(+)
MDGDDALEAAAARPALSSCRSDGERRFDPDVRGVEVDWESRFGIIARPKESQTTYGVRLLRRMNGIGGRWLRAVRYQRYFYIALFMIVHVYFAL